MTLSTIVLTGPLDTASLPDNPVLRWYLKYATVFDGEGVEAGAKHPTRFYASTAVNYAADGTINRGAEAIWNDYIYLWASFSKLTRDVRTLILVSDDEKSTYTIHFDGVTKCHLVGGKGVVDAPTAFVYVIRKAEEGAGEGGLQIWEIRSYLDRSTVERAKEMQLA